MTNINFILIWAALMLQSACTGDKEQNTTVDADMAITVLSDTVYAGHLRIEFENSLYTAAIRTRERFIKSNGPYDSCIRDWILKSTGQDQVESCIDGSAHRFVCTGAEIIYDGTDRKTVELTYGEEFIYRYTIFPSSPVIQIDYLKYRIDGKPGDWCNVVDIATPGGIDERFTATTRIFGQENWVRDLTYHHDCYWNIHYNPKKSFYQTIDDSTAGSLNYKGHLIMAVGNPANGAGFGRVMPIYRENKQGGVKVLKLLWDQGFEPFLSTGQADKLPFSGYIFVFDNGLEEAIAFGKTIVDQYTVP